MTDILVGSDKPQTMGFESFIRRERTSSKGEKHNRRIEVEIKQRHEGEGGGGGREREWILL